MYLAASSYPASIEIRIVHDDMKSHFVPKSMVSSKHALAEKQMLHFHLYQNCSLCVLQTVYRFNDISEEMPVSATAKFKETSSTAADETVEDDGSSNPLSTNADKFYVFNSETTLGPRADDGYQTVTQRKFLVPTDEAYAHTPGGAAEFAAGNQAEPCACTFRFISSVRA